MKSKLYGPSAQVTHISGEAQCRRAAARGVDGDPIGVGFVDVVVGRMRVGPREDDHSELAAARDQLAERVAVAQLLTAMMERNFGRVVRHAPAGAQTDAVAAGAAEVVEPEREVELARVVLHQRELGPPHRAIDPARGPAQRGRGATPGRPRQERRRPRRTGGPQERSPRDVLLHGRESSTRPVTAPYGERADRYAAMIVSAPGRGDESAV